MKQYLDLVNEIIAFGADKSDRTGTGTKSIFGYQMRFNLEEGFPLVTVKKTFWRGVVEELLFFLSGETNEKLLSSKGVYIWRDWADKNGNLGPVYGHSWRNFGGKHRSRKQPIPKIDKIANIERPVDISVIKTSNMCGDFIILKKLNKKHTEIQFLNSGAKYIKRDDHISGGDVYDYYAPNIYGVACHGKPDQTHALYKELQIIWTGIINRCYNPSHEHYKYYGERGVYVSNRWLVFENFMKDVSKISGWKDKLLNWKDFFLDKDTCGDGFCYSLTSTIWLNRNDNIEESHCRKVYVIQHEDTGSIEYIKNSSKFIKSNGYNQGNFNSMLRGERSRANGWYLLETREPDRGVDQIKNTIERIKTNPDCRRLIVSAWNPTEIEYCALPPCHCFFQFNVTDGKLNCQLYQRSADVFLGVPFNIASYALLTHMVAQVTGLKPGTFVHTFGDAHIYKNHFVQSCEMLKREPKPLPKLELNPDIKNIDDFKFEDIKLIGYESHPKLKGEVSV